VDSRIILPRVKTIPQFLPLYDRSNPYYKARFLTWYGGRGGRKSWEVARGLLLRGLQDNERILCTREYQNSISDSVISVIEDQADQIGVADYFDFQKTAIYSKVNETEFIFKGIRTNPRSLKSTEGVTICWNEEAQDTSRGSFEILEPTIRKAGSQIITTFNTGEETDFIYQRLVVNADAGSYVCKVLYSDNPDCPRELIEAAESMRVRDPDRFANIYLGETWSRSDAQVLSGKWRIGSVDITRADGAYLGGDFGFSTDPSTLVKSWIVGRDPVKGGGILYIQSEAFQTGVEIDDYPRFYDRIDGSRNYQIRADNARPELVSHIRKKGFNIVSCRKGDGSVEDGISLLRSFDEIVIDPLCPNAIREARTWRYKTDRLSGDVLPVLVDENNHIWDAVRYSIEPLLKPAKDISMRFA